jgi:hypothetical protein
LARIAEVGEVFPAEVPGLQVLDSLHQPWDRGDVLVLEGILHTIPGIFYETVDLAFLLVALMHGKVDPSLYMTLAPGLVF